MLNKKRGVALGELVAMLVFMFVALVAFVSCSACSVSKAKNEYEELKFSKDEIEAIKALNFFLEMDVDEEKKVYDFVIESHLSTSPDRYDELNDLALDYFFQKGYEYWRLVIDDTESNYDSLYWYLAAFLEYDSNLYNDKTYRFCDTGGSSEIDIPFIDEGELKKLRVYLFVAEKC